MANESEYKPVMYLEVVPRLGPHVPCTPVPVFVMGPMATFGGVTTPSTVT